MPDLMIRLLLEQIVSYAIFDVPRKYPDSNVCTYLDTVSETHREAVTAWNAAFCSVLDARIRHDMDEMFTITASTRERLQAYLLALGASEELQNAILSVRSATL